MAKRYFQKVDVYNTNIHAMFVPGGDVFGEMSDIVDSVLAIAVRKAAAFSPSPQAPGPSGKRIITSHRPAKLPIGKLGARGQVENSAPHAKFKHEGTQPIIVGRGRMRVRAGKWANAIAGARGGRLNKDGTISVLWVSGQQGDPWLREAANEILLRYGVVATPQRLEIL